MLFNSFAFLIFFPLVTALYFLMPHRLRWAFLLGASCIFYMWFIPVYILILAATIIVDYYAGMWIEDSEGPKRKTFLAISIVVTCLILFIFKYFNFFNTNLSALAQFIGWNYSPTTLHLLLPIGLSFHTFQSLSYVIEVYRGNQKAERHFGIYSLYVMFYPQLVAGPIERPQNLPHQFRERHYFTYVRVTDGLKLMAWGMFKKVAVADRLAPIVNSVYADPRIHQGPMLITATAFFAVQIYCDFSGYSDIARGAARVMGFNLMENFRRPYFSKSIAEFWKRWHISLSTWFQDYLYIPLGGSRCSRFRWQFNILLTFLISGLWHGANWTYVVWGLLNGAYLIIGFWTEPAKIWIHGLLHLTKVSSVVTSIKISTTFMLISFSWIFFRANSIEDAYYIVTHLFSGFDVLLTKARGFQLPQFDSTVFLGMNFGVKLYEVIIALLMIAIMEVIELRQQHGNIREILKRQPAWVRWTAYNIMIGVIIFSATSMSGNAFNFIYFQF